MGLIQDSDTTFKEVTEPKTSNTYVDVVKSRVKVDILASEAMRVFEFHMEERNMSRLRKAYVRFVENPRSSYNMHETFNIEGYFQFKSPL